jgi:hypothetical protein
MSPWRSSGSSSKTVTHDAVSSGILSVASKGREP